MTIWGKSVALDDGVEICWDETNLHKIELSKESSTENDGENKIHIFIT